MIDEKSLQWIDCTSSCCHICHLSNKTFQYVSVLSGFLCSEPVNRGVLIREARFPVSDCLSFLWPHSRSSVSFITPLTVCLLSLPRHCLFLLSLSLPCWDVTKWYYTDKSVCSCNALSLLNNCWPLRPSIIRLILLSKVTSLEGVILSCYNVHFKINIEHGQ